MAAQSNQYNMLTIQNSGFVNEFNYPVNNACFWISVKNYFAIVHNLYISVRALRIIAGYNPDDNSKMIDFTAISQEQINALLHADPQYQAQLQNNSHFGALERLADKLNVVFLFYTSGNKPLSNNYDTQEYAMAIPDIMKWDETMCFIPIMASGVHFELIYTTVLIARRYNLRIKDGILKYNKISEFRIFSKKDNVADVINGNGEKVKYADILILFSLEKSMLGGCKHKTMSIVDTVRASVSSAGDRFINQGNCCMNIQYNMGNIRQIEPNFTNVYNVNTFPQIQNYNIEGRVNETNAQINYRGNNLHLGFSDILPVKQSPFEQHLQFPQQQFPQQFPQQKFPQQFPQQQFAQQFPQQQFAQQFPQQQFPQQQFAQQQFPQRHKSIDDDIIRESKLTRIAELNKHIENIDKQIALAQSQIVALNNDKRSATTELNELTQSVQNEFHGGGIDYHKKYLSYKRKYLKLKKELS